MAECINHLLTTNGPPPAVAPPISAANASVIYENLIVLANRIARNREIAGLHYRSDSTAGFALAQSVFATLTSAANPVPTFNIAIADAQGEW
jgi:hypothetical protein